MHYVFTWEVIIDWKEDAVRPTLRILIEVNSYGSKGFVASGERPEASQRNNPMLGGSNGLYCKKNEVYWHFSMKYHIIFLSRRETHSTNAIKANHEMDPSLISWLAPGISLSRFAFLSYGRNDNRKDVETWIIAKRNSNSLMLLRFIHFIL